MQGKAASNEGVLRDTRAELNLKKDEMEDLKHQLSQGLARVYGQVNAPLSMLCCRNAPACLHARLFACLLAGLLACLHQVQNLQNIQHLTIAALSP